MGCTTIALVAVFGICMLRNIQIFGAIGFTWEMTNHLYFKRARANAELFGNARAQRARVIDMVEKKAA